MFFKPILSHMLWPSILHIDWLKKHRFVQTAWKYPSAMRTLANLDVMYQVHHYLQKTSWFTNKFYKSCPSLNVHISMLQISVYLSLFILCRDLIIRVCLDGRFRRGREGNIYFSFLNYGYYEMFFKLSLTFPS